MIFLISAILLSTSILIIFRYFSRFGIDNLQAIVSNYFIAATIGFFASSEILSVALVVQRSWFSLAVLLGLIFIGVFFLFALSSQKAGVAITAVASRMSVVIPVAGGIFLFGDQIGLIKAIGLILALAAIFFILRKNGKSELKIGAVALPLFIFIGAGTNDLLMKYAEFHFLKDDLMLFLASIFFIALIVGLIVLIQRYLKGQSRLAWKHLFAGLFLGLVNFGSTYFLIKSMMHFESSVLFPIVNAGVVSLAALADRMLFKEKFTYYNWIGIGLAILSIIFISKG